jgi:hypothetical protein
MNKFFRKVLDFSPWAIRRPRKKENRSEVEKQPGAVRMINNTSICGVQNPEKLAEGLCPHCHGLIDLWITAQGFELSLSADEKRPSRSAGRTT